MSKMRYVEKKFKEAEDFLRNTGEGLTTFDEKIGITKIQEKVLSICPFYFQVKSFMSESVAVNPPYIGETSTEENISDMLFGASIEAGFYNSPREDDPDDNSNQENLIADEERDFEEEISRQQESLPQSTSKGVPVVSEPMHSRSTPNPKPKKKKKKPKSFQEFVQDIQVQNRLLMEWKLDMQVAHHGEKLIFQREESKKRFQIKRDESQQKFALESHRLDLEFIRIEQEHKESHNRGMALQVQLEQQRMDSRNRELALQVELEKLCCHT